MTVDDIINVRRVLEAAVSPDGRHVAFVVQRLDAAQNRIDRRLLVAPTGGSTAARELAASATLRTVQWFPDSAAVAFLADVERRAQIHKVPITGGTTRRLTKHGGYLAEASDVPFQLSPDGTTVAYIVVDADDGRRAYEGEARRGIVYTRDLHYASITDVMERLQPADIWVANVADGRERKIARLPTNQRPRLTSPFLLWTGAHRLVVLYDAPGRESSKDLAELDVTTGIFSPLLTTLGWTYRMRAGDSPTSVRFVSEGELAPARPRGQYSWYSFDLRSRTLVKDESESIRRGGVQGRIADVAKHLQPTDGGLVSQCSADLKETVIACLRESSIDPPEVIVARVSPDRVPSAARQLTDFNPAYRRLARSPVRTIEVEAGGGSKVIVGVLDPIGPIPSTGSPLLVMTYNLHRPGEFVAEAGWNTSWPAQAFAGRGYTVLLVNFPPRTWSSDDVADAERAEVAGPAAAVLAAVDAVSRQQRIDRSRMAILGWSWGGFVAQYILVNHPTVFQAAATGETGLYSPASYWMSSTDGWNSMHPAMRLGPFGSQRANYERLSPLEKADRVRAPILMEFVGSHISALEFYTALTSQKGQAELVFYPDDQHIFEQPAHRYHSMVRNFDWFNFWLRGEEDGAPEKRCQYERWRAMRSALRGEQPAGGSTTCS